MRVCIPIEFRPEGGGFYFLQTFETFLRQIGWQVTKDVSEKYDVLFTNHWMTPLSAIFKAIRRNPNLRIVQRIDGAAQDYGRDPEADLRQSKINRFVDLTIFQSEYARFATRDKYAVIAQNGPVIHNPVDINTFTPTGPTRNLPGKTQVISVAWSQNPLKGAAQIYKVAENNPDIEFVLCGNFSDAPRLSNMHLLGVLKREELATVLRSCQALLTFSKNEACPNHVLEALASGLPVLYEDSGAMKEVIGDCGLAVTTQNFSSQLKEILSQLEHFSANARQRAEQYFDPKKNLSKYVDEIRLAIERPAHLLPIRRSAVAWAGILTSGRG